MASSSRSCALSSFLRTSSATPTASYLPYSLKAMGHPLRCKAPDGAGRGPAQKRSAEHVLIDHVLSDRRAVERAQDVERGLLAHAIDGLPRYTRNMRRRDDVGQCEQRMSGRGRLLLEHVE